MEASSCGDLPLTQAYRRRRIRGIEAQVEGLAESEAAVHEDEIDVHINPKIACDWMPHGVRREVVTPGNNREAYLAGVLDVRTKKLLVAEGDRKHSGLSLGLLERRLRVSPPAQWIHVVLDNYGIHHSKRALQWPADRDRSRQLHFLPPHSTNDNSIERVWQDFHASVTRNHTRRVIWRLMRAAHA